MQTLEENQKAATSTQVVRLYRDTNGTVIASQEAPEIDELEQENRLLRARNERLEKALDATVQAVAYIKQLVEKMEQRQADGATHA